jgi:flagellar basal body-associated protein FliL
MSWMGRILVIVILVVVVGLICGGVFLAFWDIPAPTEKVEKVLPDARFPK